MFAAEDVAEGIADKVGAANHHVNGMMGMVVNQCGDSTLFRLDANNPHYEHSDDHSESIGMSI